MRGGGSEPVVREFQDVLDVPIALIGFGLPDDNIHAPNEKMHLPTFYRGIDTLIHYFSILAAAEDR
jgi:acetylornithine deacetylase/succinyl-diaminopimelate desuccinylase-like protein